MSQPSDRPAPRFGPRPAHEDAVQQAIYEKIKRASTGVLSDQQVQDIRDDAAMGELTIDDVIRLCISHENLRASRAERDMEIERLRPDAERMDFIEANRVWLEHDEQTGKWYATSLTTEGPQRKTAREVVDALRAASRDEERDRGAASGERGTP